jgi:kynurenine formamidase
MPQSPNHPKYTHTLPRRHGDIMRSDGSSAANDLIVTGTHVGTHIDALAHVSFGGQLHDGSSASEAQTGGGFKELGVHTIDPIVTRGVLLDVPAALGLDECAPGYEITPSDLDAAVRLHGLEPRAGDVLLVRSGWARQFDGGSESYVGRDSGVPGVSEAGAIWLADREPLAVGGDSIAFERLAPGSGHDLLPAHRVLLVERGIYIMEAMNFEEIAEARVYEFTFVAVPLRFVGATGSPIRPLALVAYG